MKKLKKIKKRPGSAHLKIVDENDFRPSNDLYSLLALQVYGYSMGFGRADHSKTVDALKTKYPNYKIDKSDDGY